MPKAPDHRPVTARLPPPPAPVARDANPWPMPGRAGETPRAWSAKLSDHQYAPSDPVRPSRHGLARFLPIAVFFAIVASIVSGALESLGRGDRLGAFIPLIVIAIAAVSVWRSRRRSRR
jgi:hypothetical protein